MAAAAVVGAALVLAYAATAAALGRLNVSAPLVFVVAGGLLGFAGYGRTAAEVVWIRVVADTTLALVLFHDAARIHPRELRKVGRLVLRMLLIAWPLAVVAHLLTARLAFPEQPVMLSLFVAVALTPTDAGLGGATLLNAAVPVRIRAVLNAESGFNDGLATPVALFAIAALAGSGPGSPAVRTLQALAELAGGGAVGAAVPNPDGRYPDTSGDFRGQGIANLATGLLRGMPVGGSMSGTALVRAAGARSRLANVVAAVVMAVVILGLAGAVGYVAMPSLAALLMLVGFRTLKPDQVRMVWHTGPPQAAVMATTFALTLTIPLQYAVVAGVATSIVLFVVQQSNKVTVVCWTFPDGSPYPVEEPAPIVLPGGRVVALALYGSLFFASAQVVEAHLPRPGPESAGAVVVLRLRGTEDLGSTFIRTVLRYAATLREAGCALVLAGIGERVLDQLRRTGALAELGPENVFPATAQVGASLAAALERARTLQS